MGCRALKRTQLDCAGLAADFTCNIACQIICRTGKLFVSERIYKVDALSELAYIAAVRKPDAF